MTLHLHFAPRRVAILLLALVVIFTLLSVTANVLNLISGLPVENDEFLRLFNLGTEKNVTTWFSSMLMFSATALVALVAVLERRRDGRFRRHWLVLALITGFISMDSVVTFHDGTVERFIIANLETHGPFRFPWVIPGLIFVGLFVLFYWRFVMALPAPSKRYFIASGVIYLLGALVLEMLSAYLFEYHLDAILLRGLIGTVQEFLELSGIVVFIYALLLYLEQQAQTLQIALGQS